MSGSVRAPRRPRGPHQPEQRRVEILGAAAGLLAARGYHGMSMRDLSAASGMSLANLYHYFPSKEELLFALQTRAFETLIGAAAEAVARASVPSARLHGFILSHVRYVADHRAVMRVLVEEAGALPPAHRRAVRALKERYYRIGHDLVHAVALGRRGAGTRTEGPELERATYVVFGMLNWIYAWYRPEHHGTPQAVARSIHRIALSGLVGPSPSRSALTAIERDLGRSARLSPIERRPEGNA